MRCLALVVVLGACRIGFDPLIDAGASPAAAQTCTPGVECQAVAQPGASLAVVCAAGEPCTVGCLLAAACDVDCNGAAECNVVCPPTGCTVRACDASCAVACGEVGPATREDGTATCP